jgi:hypothetical protein
MTVFLSQQAECDIRDFGKKVHNLEIEFDETNDKLNKVGRTCVYSRVVNVITTPRNYAKLRAYSRKKTRNYELSYAELR